MLNKYLTALLGAVATVQALPALEESAADNNASVEVVPQKGFEVVIVYATPSNCPTKPTQCPNIFEDAPKAPPKDTGYPELPAAPTSPYKVESIKEDHEDSGHGPKGKPTATMEHDAPVTTLTPGIHWNCDTKPATNVIPVPPKKGSQVYYGVTDPSKEGQYAFITYFFTKLSVNLDHCDHVSQVEYGSNGLKVTFGSDEAFKYALDTWKAGEEMILVTYTKGCGDYAKGDRCYFKVTTLQYKKGELVIIADGKPCRPEDVISGGDTEWGWWHPRPGGGKGPSTRTLPGVGGATTVRTATTYTPTTTGKPGATFTWDPAATTTATTAPGGSSPSSPSSSGSPQASSVSSGTQPSGTPSDGSGSSGFSNNRNPCDAPADTKYGLPVACLGELFDYDLDEDLGREKTSEDYINFIDEFAPLEDYATIDPNSDDYEFWKRAERSRLQKRWDLLGAAKKYIIQPLVNVYNSAKDANIFSGSINKDISWKLPDASSEDPNAKTLKDPNAKQVTSPWGDSILLKAFGSQEPNEEKKLNGYMNVFCVGCGVSGSAKVAGKAAWGLSGITEGQVSLNTDIQFVLKLGIDAQMTYKQEFTSTLLDVGLPGLEYGLISVGPRITVGSRVELEAEAKGKLLAGAEMGLQNAHVVIDFVDSSKSTKGGWDPYFKPVFEAEGELMVAATLGLPIGIKCGLRIATWDKSVGLIDEPSIKGVAQVAASIGLDSGNKLTAGFTDIDGCTGIATQISWRNRLFIDVMGSQTPLLDTDDRRLARGCIPLPGRPSASATASASATGSTLPSGTAQASASADASATPSSTVDGEDTPSSTPTGGPVDDEEDNGEESGSGGNGDEGDDDEDETLPVDDEDDEEDVDDEDDEWVEDDEDDEDWVEDDEDDEWDDESDEDDDDTIWQFRPVAKKTVKRSIFSDVANKVIDITSKINTTGLTNVLSYTPEPMKNIPYNLSNGFEYALMVDPDVQTMVVSCADGGMYAVLVEGDDNPNCSEMWAQKDDILLTDGAARVMHYYNNTMSAIGVSRLRLEGKEEMPASGIPVAFIPYSDDENLEDGEETDDYYYLAVDPHEKVFYPIVCDYEDGTGSKLFLAEDPEKGVETLQSEDVMYTVTGGKVSACYPMVVNQGQYDGDYMSAGEETEDWDWDLEDDWYADEE